MERTFSAFIVEGAFSDEERDLVRLDKLSASELDLLLSIISRQDKEMDLILRVEPYKK